MSTETDIRPIIGVTMGDPAGIGPEIAAKALADPGMHERARLLLVGNADIMDKTVQRFGIALSIKPVHDVGDAGFETGILDVMDLPLRGGREIVAGKVSADAGDLAFRAVRKAIDLAMGRGIDAVVTGPIHKEAMNLAGHRFAGHTEIFAHYTGTEKFAMLLAEGPLRIIHVSTHVSLRRACDLVKKDRILDVIRLLNDALLRMGIRKPSIAVAGLNPHSGDGGLFGDEEIREIMPAIEAARREGLNVEGPVPPDTLFVLARGGRFDGCVAMYHDQGHIPFKVLGFDWDETSGQMKNIRGVNISLGLPVIRTSVDHGTAFEIAGKGIASPDAMLNAIEYAIRMQPANTTYTA